MFIREEFYIYMDVEAINRVVIVMQKGDKKYFAKILILTNTTAVIFVFVCTI